MIDWEHLPSFLAVARSGRLRTAAEQLNTTHGKVNRHISALEASYGVRLFDRTRKGMVLTVAGSDLLPAAEEAEAVFLNARRRLQGRDKEESGTVRVSLPATIAYELFAPIFADFMSAYPNIDLQIRITDRFEDINRLETDISIRVAYDVQDDVVAQKLFPVYAGTYASKRYIEERMPEAGASGEGLHWIGWGEFDAFPRWIQQSPYPNAPVRHAVTDSTMHIYLVRYGFGMSVLPAFYAQKFPELQLMPGCELVPDRTLWILLHSDHRRTTRVRRLVDFLASEIRKRRALIEGRTSSD